jgi:hypothetical protein
VLRLQTAGGKGQPRQQHDLTCCAQVYMPNMHTCSMLAVPFNADYNTLSLQDPGGQ